MTDLRTRLDAAEADRRKLTKTIVRMKVAGGSIPRAYTGPRLEQRKRDAIEQAVDENPRAQSNPALARHLLAWARKQRDLNVPDEDIIDRLTNWSNVDRADDDDEDEEAVI